MDCCAAARVGGMDEDDGFKRSFELERRRRLGRGSWSLSPADSRPEDFGD